jgi:hypothetical protein
MPVSSQFTSHWITIFVSSLYFSQFSTSDQIKQTFAGTDIDYIRLNTKISLKEALMKKFIFQTLFACGAILSLANCSQDNKNGQSAPPGVVGSNMCTAGSVYTQQGCLPTGSCGQYGQNYGWNGTQCVGGGAANVNNACGTGMVYSTQYGCLAQCEGRMNSGWYQGQCMDVGYQQQGGGYNNGYNNGSTNNGYNNGYNSGVNNYNTGYNNYNTNTGYNSGYNNNAAYYDRYYNNTQRPNTGVGAWYGFGVW